MSIRVLTPGWLSSVQDAGRCGHAAIGAGVAGAMDGTALRLANALVDNGADAAAIEITLRGPRLRFETDTLIALTGAAIDARCGALAIPAWRPVAIGAGTELELGDMRRGARAYLAVAGLGGRRRGRRRCPGAGQPQHGHQRGTWTIQRARPGCRR